MKHAKLCKVQDYTRCKVVPGHKPMFCNSLSAEGAKAVTIKAWALKARMLMPNSGRFVRLCVVRLCVRLTILNLFKVYMNLSLRFFHFKFFKVLKQIMYLWFKWIMERCYPHLRWYFFISKKKGPCHANTEDYWWKKSFQCFLVSCIFYRVYKPLTKTCWDALIYCRNNV